MKIFPAKWFTWYIYKSKTQRRNWAHPGIIVGRFGNKHALVHFRWSYFEVDLEGAMPANSLFGSIDWDGALTLHVPSAKFPYAI